MSIVLARLVAMATAAAAVVVPALLAPAARADAMLVGRGSARFPTAIDVDVAVRAQVESTTLVLTFPALTVADSYSLTVPAPAGARPIGVDVDRGFGFVALPVEAAAPSAAGGGTSDPAVAAWYGRAPLVAELEDLTPGPLTVRVRFVRLLRRVGGEVSFDVGVRRCPARDAYDPGARVQVHLRIATDRDLAQLDVSGGTATTVERGVRQAAADTARTDLGADEILHVRYREVASGIHAQLVAHRAPGADPLGGTDGYFLLLVDADDIEVSVPRTISLVVDRSGSMGGDKIVEARRAANVMLDALEPGDRFTIHAFDDRLDSYRAQPVDVSAADVAAARTWVDGLGARGGTDLGLGLRAGLASPASDGRFDAVVLLSDGVATSGQLDDRTILHDAIALAAGRTRVFTVSVGLDADFPLMEALARRNRGRHLDLNDAQASHELALRVRELFEDLHRVRLRDLALTIDGIGAVDTLPEAPPDLFAGGQVVIVGRYREPGVARIEVRGSEAGAPFVQTLQLDAPARIDTDDVIRFVWASEQVRALMASLADGADPAQVRAAVEALGLAYRIQTPFTRYAGGGGSVDDPEVTISPGGCRAGGDDRGTGVALVVVLALIAAGLAHRHRRHRGHRRHHRRDGGLCAAHR
jgi:Ca-activated chloride channel family protein